MRKLTAISFALLITVSAVAAPNDSSERERPGTITRIVRHIKSVIHALVDGGPIPPIPVTGQ